MIGAGEVDAMEQTLPLLQLEYWKDHRILVAGVEFMLVRHEAKKVPSAVVKVKGPTHVAERPDYEVQ